MNEAPETISMWNTIESYWQSGRFNTMGALHRKCVELFSDQCPTLRTIRNRASREMWVNDGAVSEQIKEESQKAASEILNELGMGLTRRLELLSEIIIAPHEDHDRIKSILDKLFTGNGTEISEKSIGNALKDLRTLYSNGMKVSLAALQLAGQYAGDIAGKQREGDGEEKHLGNMTEEERHIEIDRMLKSLGKRLVPEKSDISTGV